MLTGMLAMLSLSCRQLGCAFSFCIALSTNSLHSACCCAASKHSTLLISAPVGRLVDKSCQLARLCCTPVASPQQTSPTFLQAGGVSCAQCNRLLADKIVDENSTISSNNAPKKACYLVKVQRWMGGTQGSGPGLTQLHCPK